MNIRDLASIVDFLENEGAILFIRHGNTTKGEKDKDFDRALTPKGLLQAKTMRDQIENYDAVDVVITSCAPRAINTVSDERWPNPVTVDELYFTPRDTPENIAEANTLDQAFDRLKYASLADYYADAPEVRAALDRWATRAAIALDKAIGEHYQNTNAAGVIVIGGHAVVTNALVHMIMETMRPGSDRSVVLKTQMGECDYLDLSLGDDDELRLEHVPVKMPDEPPTAG